MNTKYSDLINQTYYFPQEEFKLEKDNLQFHNIDLMKLVEKYGTPLKFTYLPQISNNINKAKGWFRKSMEKNNEIQKNSWVAARGYYLDCIKTEIRNRPFNSDALFDFDTTGKIAAFKVSNKVVLINNTLQFI